MELIFGTIPEVLKGLASNDDSARAMIFVAWRQVAGDLVNVRTQPVDYFENRLVIAVADRTWQRILEELAPEMLVKLNRIAGEGSVRFIEFRIDPTALRHSATKEMPKETATKSTLAPSLIAAANRIEDERLRETFLGAAAAYIKG